jgi:CheY-like chemotaxis protein
VLIAEDNSVNQRVAARFLEKQGHTATVVENGKQALDALEHSAFDMVLMDIQMPEMDGFQATQAIRSAEQGTGRHLPIVAMTAYAMKGDCERCLAAGMDAYIPKPIQASELLRILQALPFGAATLPSSSTLLAAPPTAPFDSEVLLSMLGGDEDLRSELIRLFLKNVERQMQEIEVAAEPRDDARLYRAAHSLKGSTSSLAATPSSDAALELEQACERGDAAGIVQALAKLRREVGRLRADLNSADLNPELAAV